MQSFLTSIEVAPQAGGWQIRLIEPGNALTFPVGAACGGWLDGHTLRAGVIFLETPHRMDITCSLPGRTAQAVWRHPPFAPSTLAHLHCPA